MPSCAILPRLNGLSSTSSNTKMQFTYSINPVTPSPTPTASNTPTATISVSNSFGATPSSTSTASPSGTPSSSPKANIFQPDSVLVVRVGNSTYAAGTIANGVSLPVFIDEYSPWAPGGVYSTLALPALCTLATGLKPTVSPYIWHDTSGFPSLANDQSVIALPCWRLPFGTTITDTTAVIKTVMLVRADGSFDASTTMTWPYAGSLGNPISMHNVAMNTYSNPGPPSGIYVAFGGGCE